MPVTAIGFDADDTLWRHAQFYREAEVRLAALLSGHAEAEVVLLKPRDAERRNLPLYGFGVKGFTLSMIETAIEASGGRASAALIAEIVASGRDLLRHPLEILPHARETLGALASRYRLILITKGEFFDQERKLEASGLGEFSDAVEIVSNKNAATYARLFTRHGEGPARALMVGDSLKSDVIPAIEAGGWGVHIRQTPDWVVERAEPPEAAPRFRRLDHLGELAALVAQIAEDEPQALSK